LKLATSSASGLVEMNPSAIRAAASIALGPNPDMKMRGVSSGSV